MNPFSLLLLTTALAAAPAPQGIRAQDRIYTADQTSNTVSIYEPSTHTLVGLLPLGAPRSEVLSPLYRGQASVHGLGFSPDHRTLAVVSITSNAVTFVDLATNRVKGTVYVGRAPHEAFFTPEGREVWVSVRGEDYVAILDPVGLRETRRIRVADGPGMVRFRADGKVGFVVSSFTPEVAAVDVKSHQVLARIPVVSPFSPNLDVCADGQLWMTHKDVGKVTVIDARTFRVLRVLDTGPITNHVVCVDNEKGAFAFVSVGGQDVVKVFTREAEPRLVATLSTGALPHGLWPSDDGTRVFVGLENGDGIAVLDALTFKELTRIAGGQAPQALVYVSNAVPSGEGRQGLTPLAQWARPLVVELKAPGGGVQGSAIIRALGPTDALDVSVRGLAPGSHLELVLLQEPQPPQPLASLELNPQGGANVQALGPLRQVVQPPTGAEDAGRGAVRRLVVRAAGGGLVLLEGTLP